MLSVLAAGQTSEHSENVTATTVNCLQQHKKHAAFTSHP